MSYTSRQLLVQDATTFANYSAMGSTISNTFAQAGWLQATDTGQVMWSGMNITACTHASPSPGFATYTYNTLTGLALANGRALTITGLTAGSGANNGTFRIVSFTGTTSGTFTVASASASDDSAASGVVTIATLPGTASSLLEIWSPGDGGTAFYVLIKHFRGAGSCYYPNITIGTGTSGLGALTGLTTGSFVPIVITSPGTTPITYECYFSGDTNRISICAHRNSATPWVLAIERTKNANGTDSSDGVWIGCEGLTNSSFTGNQTIVFGVAAGTAYGNGAATGMAAFTIYNAAGVPTVAFNSGIAVSPIFPEYGKFGNPILGVCYVATAAAIPGCTFTTTVYGSTRTYLATSATCTIAGPTNSIICIRYD